MVTPQLYLSNKPNQLNKDILSYLHNNLNSIVKMGIYIEFIVAHPEESEEYSRIGIDNFPTLLVRKKSHVGVDQIKNFFNLYYQSYKKRINERTVNDDVNDYWNDILSKGDEGDEDYEESEKMKSRAQNAVQERQEKLRKRKTKPQTKGNYSHRKMKKEHSKKQNLEPSALDVIKTMKSSGQEALDDQLMANFFANKVETNI